MKADAKIAPVTEETKDGAAAAQGAKAVGVAGGPPGAADSAELEAAKKPKISRKNKNYYLLMAKTEEYADDSELYRPRISRDMRLDYWEKMVDQKVRRKAPKGVMTYQEAWMQGDYDAEGPTYPSIFVWQLALIRSQMWDYLYLLFLLLYLLIIIAVYDGLGNSIDLGIPLTSSNSTSVDIGIEIGTWTPELQANAEAIGLGPATMILPVVFMLFVQAPPAVGIFYFVTRCNDLVKYKARTTNFGSWAFASIMIAQAVEFFLYGGADNVKAAGTCAYGNRAMAMFGEKKVVLPDLDAIYNREEASDDEEDFFDDPYPEGHHTIDEKIAQARQELEEDPENPEKQRYVQGKLEMSFLQKILSERKALEDAEVERVKAEELARELKCVDWTEWTCMVCNKHNRRPTHPPSVSDIFFGTKGIFYKRTFAIIRKRRDSPQCKFCRTYCDYTPPLCSAHQFPYNKAPYRAFNKYPMQTPVQAGLFNTPFYIYKNKVLSFLFGLRDNSSSLLVYNDWRLRLYLNGRFPETPRQVKKKDDLYQVGEFLECRLQKSDWQRCQITRARKNHTYDLRYDPGDELRLVEEKELRLPPEKRSFAYIVEVLMVYLFISFPVGLIASQTITPGLLTFFPFCAAGFLLFLRVSKFIQYFREYKFAGCWTVMKLSLFYTLPIFLMFISCAMPLIGTPWLTTVQYWMATKFVSLPVLYIMKPHFAVFCLILFMQTSAGFYMLAAYADGVPVVDKMAIAIGPLVTAVLTLMYYRRNLATFIDVGMVIRPPLNFIKPENICIRLYHRFFAAVDPHATEVDPEIAAQEAAASTV